jgi:hypothetical protein
MNGPNDKNSREAFLDIRRSKGGVFGWLPNPFRKHAKTVNLKPPFYKRYPLVALAVVLLVVSLTFAARKMFTRAEVADFYPSACLGSWADIQNAQGEPEMLRATSSSAFNENNSAVLSSGEGQIFCGSFVPPDYPVQGDIVNVGLTFVWQVGEPTPTSAFPQTTAMSDERQATSTEINLATTTAPTSPVASSTEEQSGPPAATSTSSFLRDFKNFAFGIAFAQNESGPVVVNETTAPPAYSDTRQATSDVGQAVRPSDSAEATADKSPGATAGEASSSQEVIIGPPIQATLTPITGSTSDTRQATGDMGQATGTIEDSGTAPIIAPALAPPTPDNNFLKISYSVNGHEWIEIGKVNPENWQNFTITMPLRSWQDIKNFQVQIERIPTSLNPAPKVYLDGMFMEVHYEIPPALAGIIGGGGGASEIGENSNSIAVPAGTPVIVLPPSQKPTPVNPEQNTFRADEAPQFNFDLNSLSVPSSTPNP